MMMLHCKEHVVQYRPAGDVMPEEPAPPVLAGANALRGALAATAETYHHHIGHILKQNTIGYRSENRYMTKTPTTDFAFLL